MADLSYVMLATLGGQPQVVTFALDDLLRQGFRVHEVIVLHLMPPTDAPRVQRAITRLVVEFNGQRYAGRPCRLTLLPVQDARRRLDDIYDEASANAAWSSLYTLIAELKMQQRHLHICIAGGRRMLALLAMSAAMLHFDHDDRLWHMFTPPDFLERARDGAIMHAQPGDNVRLIRVPLMPWGAYLPGLRQLAQMPPDEGIATQTQQLDGDTRRRCRAVLDALTPRQRDTLRAFAAGQSPQEVAETMCVTVKTVHAHKTEILDACRNAWEIPEGGRLTYYFLREKFGRMADDEWQIANSKWQMADGE
ncbi:MAG: histidine kinase [Anaerolineae bacterium]|nr:histidine kinase [Anaerolineae bacterium]